MNFSEFETIQKIKKSAAAIRKHEKELAKQEKVLAENQLLAERLGLDKNAEGQTLRASEEAAIMGRLHFREFGSHRVNKLLAIRTVFGVS